MAVVGPDLVAQVVDGRAARGRPGAAGPSRRRGGRPRPLPRRRRATVASQSSSSPGPAWTPTAIWLAIVPVGTNSAASLPEQLGRPALEGVDGRVFADDVVADLGLGHRRPHRRRGAGDGVGPQVDDRPGHGVTLGHLSRPGRDGGRSRPATILVVQLEPRDQRADRVVTAGRGSGARFRPDTLARPRPSAGRTSLHRDSRGETMATPSLEQLAERLGRPRTGERAARAPDPPPPAALWRRRSSGSRRSLVAGAAADDWKRRGEGRAAHASSTSSASPAPSSASTPTARSRFNLMDKDQKPRLVALDQAGRRADARVRRPVGQAPDVASVSTPSGRRA